jgi:hypothetical protein
MAARPRIAIAGSLAQKPRQGGHTWQFLNYLLGLKGLGWEVLFLDRLEAGMCVDAAGGPCDVEDSVNLSYFLDVMHRFGLADSFSLDYGRGERVYGRSRRESIEFLRTSAAVINVMGFLVDEELLAAAPLRVFLDTDPGFGQMWCDLGQADLFRGHDRHVTIAENIGTPACTIPTCGIDWITWRQPIVLDQWPAQPPALPADGGRFTSIGAWRGPYAPVEHRGHTYGLRVHEFRKFAALPRTTDARFEVALDIHAAETRDITLLADNGWTLADPAVVARDPWVYRDYLAGSAAEFMATKGMYVDTRSGWFSERSICYLASGRPVLAQDTGLAGLYPLGEGLVVFTTPDEAAAGVAEILGDYPRHARAARALAEECFDSRIVLAALLSRIGVA